MANMRISPFFKSVADIGKKGHRRLAEFSKNKTRSVFLTIWSHDFRVIFYSEFKSSLVYLSLCCGRKKQENVVNRHNANIERGAALARDHTLYQNISFSINNYSRGRERTCRIRRAEKAHIGKR